MSDQLEDWLKTYRQNLDVEAPPVGHSERFAQKLNAQPGASHNNWYWWAAAVVLSLLAISFLIGRNSHTTLSVQGKSLASVSPELAEVEEHLASQVAIRLQDMHAYRPTDPDLVGRNLEILQALDQEYAALRQDLADNPDDQRVVNSMIVNYRIRLRVMERMIDVLASINKKEPENDDIRI